MFSSWEKERNPWVPVGAFPLMLQDSSRCLKGRCYEWEDNTKEKEVPCPVSLCTIAHCTVSYFTFCLSVCRLQLRTSSATVNRSVPSVLSYRSLEELSESWVRVLCVFNLTLLKMLQMDRDPAQKWIWKELKLILNSSLKTKGMEDDWLFIIHRCLERRLRIAFRCQSLCR